MGDFPHKHLSFTGEETSPNLMIHVMLCALITLLFFIPLLYQPFLDFFAEDMNKVLSVFLCSLVDLN